ncbi:hypothetical protein BGX21_001721, partial [Mortierella sp. AD011]
GSTKISSDSLQKKGRAKERTLDQINGQILPQSIISIDIGIRNFAWVELSRDGEILRWSIEDLLSASGSKDNNSTELSITSPNDNDQTGGTIDLGNAKSQQAGSRTRDAVAAAVATKKTKKKSNPGLPFDLWPVALRIDEIMRRVVTSDSIGAVVVEKQRFRTGGMSGILDAIFRCGVIEGMVHSWLAAWKNNQAQRNVNGDGDTDGIGVEENTLVESICPRAVALQWGIGAASRKDSSSKSKDEGQKCQAKGDQKTLRKTVTYREKKSQSKAIVENWIYNNGSTSKADNNCRDQILGSKSSVTFFMPSSKLHVRCNPEIKDWYSNQKKRDDLCDSVLQAVSWYEWKQRAIQEAVERAGINQATFESGGHDSSTGLTTPSNIVDQTNESGNVEKKQKKKSTRCKIETATDDVPI